MGLNNRKENRKMEQTIQLSDHFGYRRLIRFTIPSILMMIFTSIYGVVDGFFVSNFVGKTSFAAVNFIMPFLMITGVMGFMFGTGGSALIAKIPSLTVAEIKNRCIPCVYWGTAIFVVVMKYSNLFFSFAFFLDRSHFAFGYELIISSEAAGFMKIICNGFTLI